jgi:hypothetical protein
MKSKQNKLYIGSILNSSLSLPLSPTSGSNSKWSIFIVGLRSDLQQNSSSLQQQYIPSWKTKYSHLPLIDKLFIVSSFTATTSVQQLLHALETECSRIFNEHAIRIPSLYRSTLLKINNHPDKNDFLVNWKILKQEHNIEIEDSIFKMHSNIFIQLVG